MKPRLLPDAIQRRMMPSSATQEAEHGQCERRG
jgi:hypothetical protein